MSVIFLRSLCHEQLGRENSVSLLRTLTGDQANALDPSLRAAGAASGNSSLCVVIRGQQRITQSAHTTHTSGSLDTLSQGLLKIDA